MKPNKHAISLPSEKKKVQAISLAQIDVFITLSLFLLCSMYDEIYVVYLSKHEALYVEQVTLWTVI
jgi:hypothetical protein